jgi:glycosyltransferase involved in cell wall biosynthesis
VEVALAARTPVVSVIIPTYNRLPLLRETVNSVLAQTFTDWELIVADDGSTDATRPYLEELAVNDDRVRPIFLEHAGSMTAMRTAAIREMRGTWIALLDSDDLWSPRKLEVQLGELARYPASGWSYTGFYYVNESGNPVDDPALTLPEPVSGWIVEQLLTFTVGPAIPTFMMRHDLFLEVGGFDQQLLVRSDYDLILRLAVRSAACAVPAKLAMVRVHGGRTSDAFPVLGHLKENAVMFDKARDNVPNAHLRSVCARQGAVQRMRIAALYRHDGHYLAAFRWVMAALLLAPGNRFLWREVLRQAPRQLWPRRRRNNRRS